MDIWSARNVGSSSIESFVKTYQPIRAANYRGEQAGRERNKVVRRRKLRRGKARPHTFMNTAIASEIVYRFLAGERRSDLADQFGLVKDQVIDILDLAGVSNSGINRLIKREQGKCVTCGMTEHLTRDHIRPISKGGTDNPRNIQIMCKPCNNQKGDSWDGLSGWPKEKWAGGKGEE